MIHLKIALTFLGLLFVVEGATAQSKFSTGNAFEEWLGPQGGRAISISKRIPKPIDRKVHDKLRHYELSLRVVKGTNLAIPKSRNPLVLFKDGELRQVDKFSPESESRYVVSTFNHKEGGGWRFYTLDAKVTGGPLKGAVVHFRDDRIQEEMFDPCTAIFKIPSSVKIEEGDIPFEVISLFAK